MLLVFPLDRIDGVISILDKSKRELSCFRWTSIELNAIRYILFNHSIELMDFLNIDIWTDILHILSTMGGSFTFWKVILASLIHIRVYIFIYNRLDGTYNEAASQLIYQKARFGGLVRSYETLQWLMYLEWKLYPPSSDDITNWGQFISHSKGPRDVTMQIRPT